MNKEDLARQRQTDIAYALILTIEDNNRNKPFVPGWEDRVNSATKLIDNIAELYKHPRKNRELLYFLNEFADSYYISGKEEK